MQKRTGLYLLMALLLVSVVSASVIDDLETLKNNIGLTEPLVVVLVRVAILLLITVLLFEVLSKVGLSQFAAGSISFVLALITCVFMPGGVILAISTTYGTLFSLILLLIPIAALLFIVYVVIPGSSLGWRILRISLIVLVIVLLYLFKSWVNTL